MDDNKIRKRDFLEGVFGGLMDLLPIVCAVLIVLTAGTAYREGYRLFVQEGLDKPGEAHSEMISITEEDASSALAVGRLLERQDLIGSRYFFALKAKLSGADGMILPGTYILSSDMTADDILTRICTDPAVETGQQEEGAAAEEESAGSGEETENRDVWGQ